jgi:chromosome segregation ATPase
VIFSYSFSSKINFSQERIDSIQCLLSQREQLDKLNKENHFVRNPIKNDPSFIEIFFQMSQSLDSLCNELRTKDETIKILEDKLYDRDELLRDNDFLRVQLKLMEQKFDRFTMDYSKKLEENRQHEHEYVEQIQSLMDEIERIKRDLVLEEYRKQEAERKVRYYDEKTKTEQNLNKKFQQDILQLKQELKSIHMKYDSLQIEMLAMHEANNNDISLIPTKDTNDEWTKKRAIDHENVGEY